MCEVVETAGCILSVRSSGEAGGLEVLEVEREAAAAGTFGSIVQVGDRLLEADGVGLALGLGVQSGAGGRLWRADHVLLDRQGHLMLVDGDREDGSDGAGGATGVPADDAGRPAHASSPRLVTTSSSPQQQPPPAPQSLHAASAASPPLPPPLPHPSTTREKELLQALEHFQAEGIRMENVAKEQYALRLKAQEETETLAAKVSSLKRELHKRDEQGSHLLLSGVNVANTVDASRNGRKPSPSRRLERQGSADVKRLRSELLAAQRKVAALSQENTALRQDAEEAATRHAQELISARSARSGEGERALRALKRQNDELRAAVERGERELSSCPQHSPSVAVVASAASATARAPSSAAPSSASAERTRRGSGSAGVEGARTLAEAYFGDDEPVGLPPPPQSLSPAERRAPSASVSSLTSSHPSPPRPVHRPSLSVASSASSHTRRHQPLPVPPSWAS